MEPDETRDADGRRWVGPIAGAVAAAVALAFGALVGAISDTIPSLVLGMGEWIVDIAPGQAARASIENLGSNGKKSLLPGITIVALVLGALLGDLSARRSRWIGVGGLAAFGVLGGFTTARNPGSPAFASWLWALVAAGLAIATLLFLLARPERPPDSPRPWKSPRTRPRPAGPS
ncbi:MAG: hypothetical protein R2695_10835 [Acidimicrobiales bacterium]